MIRTRISEHPMLCLLLFWLVASGFVALPADATGPTHPPTDLASALERLAADRGDARELRKTAPIGSFDSRLDRDGLRLSGIAEDGPWQLGLRLEAHGRADARIPTDGHSRVVRRQGARTELDHGRLIEWTRRSGQRVTYGIELRSRPFLDAGTGGRSQAEAGSGSLIFELEPSGTFGAELSADGRSIELRDGSLRFGFGELSATDATGRTLPSRIELRESALRLTVQDAGAAYPLFLTSSLTEVKKLVFDAALGFEHAGWSVAIDGDTAVVGARFADVPLVPDAGRVYLYERNQGGAENWGFVKELRAGDPQIGGHFGVSVDISGDYIIVGANNADILPLDNNGKAYLFERNMGGTDNWGQIKAFDNPTPALLTLGDLYGWSVAIDGDTAAISALWADIWDGLLLLHDVGEVYIYQKDEGGFDQWGEVAVLTTPNPNPSDSFGQDLDLHGDTLVVGAFFDEAAVGVADTGAAHVFERNQGGPDNWGLTTTLLANDGLWLDRFGDIVDIDGDVIVVGADFADNTGIDTGSAYVYERNSGGANFWGQVKKLTSDEPESGDYFGWGATVEGDTIVIGAHADDSPLLNAGSAFLFRQDEGGPSNWGLVEKFVPAGLTPGDDFGIAMDLSNGTLLVGAQLDRDVLDQAGAAYIFELSDSTDLSISVSSSPDPVAPGTDVTYTITVQNLGSSDATDVVVSTLFGPDAGTGSTTAGCAEDPNGAATCSLGTIAAGGSAQYTLTRPVPGGATGSVSLTATVSASTDDPAPANDQVTEVTLVGGGGGGDADLFLLKMDSVDPVPPGGSLTYTLEVTNNGPDEAENVVVTDILPAGMTNPVTSGCAGDPAGLPDCALGNILPGFSASFTVTVDITANAGAALVNTASVTSDTGDSAPQDNTATEVTNVGAGEADLTITLEDDVDPINAGDMVTYTITVINNGTSAAPDTVVETTLPASLTGASSAGCAEDPAGHTSCSLGEIASGGIATFTISAMSDPAVFETLIATASVTSSALDNAPSDNTATEATSVAALGDVDLFVIQTDSEDPVDAGETVTYTIYIGNRGPATAQSVVLQDVVPAGVNNPVSSGCDEDGGGVPICTIGSVAMGEIEIVTVTVGIPADATGGTLTNEVSVSAANNELDPSDNSATETTTVIGAPGMANLILTIEEVAPPTTLARGASTVEKVSMERAGVEKADVSAGDSLSYEIKVINTGPHNTADATVSVTLPEGLSNATTSGCVEDPSALPTCNLGGIEVGLPKSFVVTADIDLDVSGPITISASILSGTDDPDMSNNSDSETTDVEGVALADLKIAIGQAADTAAPGGSASYEVTVENLGPDTATAVSVATAVTGSVDGSTTTGCAEDPSGLAACGLGDLASGAMATFTIELMVGDDASGTLDLTATVSSDVTDPDAANDSASHQTTIDASPPRVTNIHSVGDTGGGELAHCEEARIDITELLVTFSEAMNQDGAAPTVTDPAAYELIGSGPDRDIRTNQCDMLEGDDQRIPIAAVTYDEENHIATLEIDGALDDGPYRLLVCETLTDAAGTGLDGDDDGAEGRDFGRYFRVDTHNLFARGHFDCNLDRWSEVAETETEIKFTALDVDDALVSGAAVFFRETSTDLSIGQCVEMGGSGNYGWTGSLWLKDLETDMTLRRVCQFFSSDLCDGSDLGTQETSQTFTASADDWQALDGFTVAPPEGTGSALCSIDASIADQNGAVAIFLDDLVLGSRVFADGFESGDLGAWSMSTEP